MWKWTLAKPTVTAGEKCRLDASDKVDMHLSLDAGVQGRRRAIRGWVRANANYAPGLLSCPLRPESQAAAEMSNPWQATATCISIISYCSTNADTAKPSSDTADRTIAARACSAVPAPVLCIVTVQVWQAVTSATWCIPTTAVDNCTFPLLVKSALIRSWWYTTLMGLYHLLPAMANIPQR